MSKFSEYKRQRIVSLWNDGFKAPTIAKILAKENLPATRQVFRNFSRSTLSVELLAEKRAQVESQS